MKTDVKYWYLHNHGIFSQLTESELKELGVWVGFIKATRNQKIILMKDNVKRIYFLKKGKIKIVKTNQSSREVTVDFFQEEDIFGEISLNSHCSGMDNYYIKAITEEAVICTFTLENFENILKKNPSLAIEFSKKLGDKVLKFQTKYSDLVFKDVKTRLLDFLQTIQLTADNPVASFNKSNYNLTHQDIADLIGCSRQTVTSLMNELKIKDQVSVTNDLVFDLNTISEQ